MATDSNTPNNAFASNGGGAAFGNPSVTRQAAISGATQAGTGAGGGRGFVNPPIGGPTQAPPNAAAAVTNTNEVFTGLVTALNTYQQRLVKQTKAEYPDVYIIEFSPADMQNSTLKKPDDTDNTKVAFQTPTAANQLNPKTDSVDFNSRIWQVTAGTQVVQLIDQVIRSSSYITSQQTVQVAADGTQTPNQIAKTGGTAWYKITAQAKQLQYDNIRRDHAYELKYIITPYAINQAASNFFADSNYRGSHKSYNYWFTGLNTQILSYEQEYNNLYRLVISGIGNNIIQNSRVDFRGADQFRKTALATSGQHTQGADGYTNEPGDNLADFLYSPTDQAHCKIKIVGDPAWMQQGEVGAGIGPSANFSFQPFNADGGINYDSQQVVFDISFNRPTDYDFNTGIMNVNAQNKTIDNQSLPHENFTYTAIKCKNLFSKGRFEQEIEGRLLIEFNKNPTSTANQLANGRPVVDQIASSANQTLATAARTGVNLSNTSAGGGRGVVNNLANAFNNDPTSTQTSNQAPANPQPLPAADPAAPDSTGDINSDNGQTPEDQVYGDNNTDANQFMDKEA